MKSRFPSGKEQMSAVWSYPSCFFLGLKFLLMLVNKISDVVSKGWFSLAHKHNISITSENTHKHKQKHKKNKPTYLSYAVLTCE